MLYHRERFVGKKNFATNIVDRVIRINRHQICYFQSLFAFVNACARKTFQELFDRFSSYHIFQMKSSTMAYKTRDFVNCRFWNCKLKKLGHICSFSILTKIYINMTWLNIYDCNVTCTSIYLHVSKSEKFVNSQLIQLLFSQKINKCVHYFSIASYNCTKKYF